MHPRIVAAAQAANVASIRVLEKSGLKLEKKFIHEELGVEVVIYSLSKDDGLAKVDYFPN